MLRRQLPCWVLALVCAVTFVDTALAQAPRPPFPFGLNERYFGYRPRVYGYWPSAYVYPRYGYVRGTGYDLYHFPAPPPGSGFPNQPYGACPDWMNQSAPVAVEGESAIELLDPMAIDSTPIDPTASGTPYYPNQ